MSKDSIVRPWGTEDNSSPPDKLNQAAELLGLPDRLHEGWLFDEYRDMIASILLKLAQRSREP